MKGNDKIKVRDLNHNHNASGSKLDNQSHAIID